MARLFVDSDILVPVEWYPCQPGAASLGMETFMLNNRCNWFPELWDGLGMQWDDDFQFGFTKKRVGALGVHVCGTPDQFANGLTYDPLRDIKYATNGLPLCCTPAPGVRGGAGAGGTSVPSYAPPVVPGTTCDTAGVLPFETTYSGSISGAGLQWFRTPVLSDATAIYYLTLSDVVGDHVTALFNVLPCTEFTSFLAQRDDGTVTGSTLFTGEPLSLSVQMTFGFGSATYKVKWGTVPPGP